MAAKPAAKSGRGARGPKVVKSVTTVTRSWTTTRTQYAGGRVSVYRTANNVKPKRTPAAKRSAPGIAALSPEWITADNDTAPSCVAVAIANSLLAQTGIRVTDADVLTFHEHTADRDGVSIPDALSQVLRFGLAGHKPVSYMFGLPVHHLTNGALVGLSDGRQDHAVTYTPAGLISWGAPLDEQDAAEWRMDGEVWFLDWTGEEEK